MTKLEIVAILLGIIVTLFTLFFYGKNFENYFNRPILRIYYDADLAYVKGKVRRTHDVPILHHHDDESFFCFLNVVNEGRSTANNCEATLMSIKVYDSDSFKKVQNYLNIEKLKWGHELNVYTKNIENQKATNIPYKLEICWAEKGKDKLRFATDKQNPGNQTDYPPGVYTIKIKITCDNANSVEKEFIIIFETGDFESIIIKNTNEHWKNVR